MRKTCLIWTLLTLSAATPALAVEGGLEGIQITVDQEPGGVDGILEYLETQPGFLEASWEDSSLVFSVAVEESVRVVPREIVQGIEERGVTVETLRFDFHAVQARIIKGTGTVISSHNDLQLVVLYGKSSKRLWTFLGRSLQGPDSWLEMGGTVLLGSPDSLGAFAPDTLDIKRFQLTVRSE